MQATRGDLLSFFSGGGETSRLRFTRNRLATTLEFDFEISNDLEVWYPLEEVTLQVLEETQTRETLEATFSPEGVGPWFIRLRYGLQP